MKHRIYLKVLVALVLLCIAAVALFNWFVDPFNLYDSPRVERLNSVKPFALHYELQSKTYRLDRLRPQALVLGNSRPDFGIDPEHPAWAGLVAYNAAYGGGSLSGAIEHFRRASRQGRLQQVVLAVDIDMMRRGKRALRAAGANVDDFFRTGNAASKSSPNWPGADYWATLLSFDSTIVSMKTLLCQGVPPKFELLKSGWVVVRSDFKEPARHRFRVLEDRWAEVIYHPDEKGRASYAIAPQRLDAFREILKLAYAQGVEMKIVINPSHARKYILYRQAGLENQIFAFKRILLQVNQEEAERAGRTPFPLWDFFNFNQFTNEVLGNGVTMRWWFEPSHYTPELGRKVMDRVLNTESDTAFGAMLDMDNMEHRFRMDRRDAELYERSHAADAEDIREVIRRARVAAEMGGAGTQQETEPEKTICDVN